MTWSLLEWICKKNAPRNNNYHVYFSVACNGRHAKLLLHLQQPTLWIWPQGPQCKSYLCSISPIPYCWQWQYAKWLSFSSLTLFLWTFSSLALFLCGPYPLWHFSSLALYLLALFLPGPFPPWSFSSLVLFLPRRFPPWSFFSLVLFLPGPFPPWSFSSLVLFLPHLELCHVNRVIISVLMQGVSGLKENFEFQPGFEPRTFWLLHVVRHSCQLSHWDSGGGYVQYIPIHSQAGTP